MLKIFTQITLTLQVDIMNYLDTLVEKGLHLELLTPIRYAIELLHEVLKYLELQRAENFQPLASLGAHEK